MKKSLFRKLLFSFLAVIVITILLIAALFSKLINNYFMQNEERELMAKGHELGIVLSEYLQGEKDETTLNYLINTLDKFWGARIWAVDKKGAVFLLSDGKGTSKISTLQRGAILNDREVSAALSGTVTKQTGLSPYMNDVVISIGIPIIDADKAETIGAVFLSKPVFALRQANENMYKLLLLAAAVSVLLSSLIGFYLSKTLSRPLRKMNITAMEMARGNYKNRIDNNREDEIGQLGTTLNYLSGELDKNITALQHEKSKLEQILLSLREGIIAVDYKGNIVHYNRLLGELLKIDTVLLNGMSINQLSENEWLADMISGTLANGSQKTAKLKIGNTTTVQIYTSPIVDDNRKVIGATALIQDISEMEQLEQMRRDYIANISHELRTPLTAIRGFIEPLIDGTIDDKGTADKYHKVILAETLRLQRLINDTLELSRLQAGHMEVSFEKLDIKSVINRIVLKFKLQAEKKHILIHTRYRSDVLFVSSNEDRLEQLFLILVDNAIKYTPQCGKIEIAAGAENDRVQVSISDTGIGIPPEDLKHIWERFYKVDKSRKGSTGTGLGLSIAKHIIELLDGEISVASEAGKGTTFYLCLKKYMPDMEDREYKKCLSAEFLI